MPTLVATAISTTEIRLTWSVADNGGAAITDYDLRDGIPIWHFTAGSPPICSVTTLIVDCRCTVTLYIDTSRLEPGTTYHYRINANKNSVLIREACSRLLSPCKQSPAFRTGRPG